MPATMTQAEEEEGEQEQKCSVYATAGRRLCLTPAAAASLLREHRDCDAGCDAQQVRRKKSLPATSRKVTLFGSGRTRRHPSCVFVPVQFAITELFHSLPAAGTKRLSICEEQDTVDALLQILGRREGSCRLKMAATRLLPVMFRNLSRPAFTPERRGKVVNLLLAKLETRRSDAAMTDVLCDAIGNIVRENADCRVRSGEGHAASPHKLAP